MIGLVVLSALAGPPMLPPLPSERRAQEAAAAQEASSRAREDGQTPAAEPAAGAGAGADDGAGDGAAEAAASPGATAGEVPAAAPSGRPRNMVSLGAIAAKEQPQPLEDASREDLDAWGADDEIQAEEAVADPALRAEAVPGNRPRAPRGRPMRTATGLHTQARLEQPGATAPPKRSSAFAFGYRLFQTQDAFARQQSWHVGSVEVTPVRRFVRFNLITEVGAEGGAASRGGDRADLFFMQKAGLGLQYPHWLTPFVEFQGGAGVARVEVFDRSDVLLIWSLGVDAGAQWAVTRWMSLHAAVGWIRPTFRRPEQTVFHNAFTFKIGVGF